MLTLENPPPTLETCSELNGEDYRKTYSRTFSKMIEKCLQKDPSKRYCHFVFKNHYVVL